MSERSLYMKKHVFNRLYDDAEKRKTVIETFKNFHEQLEIVQEQEKQK